MNLGEAKSVFKRGQRCTQMHVSDMEKGVPVKSKKVADIKKLLEAHYGENWLKEEKLQFLRTFLRTFSYKLNNPRHLHRQSVVHKQLSSAYWQVRTNSIAVKPWNGWHRDAFVARVLYGKPRQRETRKVLPGRFKGEFSVKYEASDVVYSKGLN
ncbi:unnamed protein product [Brassicogethes aeneus]|uniref:Uncharacterized protein n=1 Tax=Brassicogethes aeneus TaxID=1431903 RepID=A0A9P0B8T4_BRAAE|nr:unnamed protein product [Brassicogethes aeneus]